MIDHCDPCEDLLAKWMTTLIYLWTRDMEQQDSVKITEAYITQHILAINEIDPGDVIYESQERLDMAERIIAKIGL